MALSKITNASLSTGIDSAKIGAGDVSNTEHAYLNSISSNVQTQIAGAGGQYAISTGTFSATSTTTTTITGISFTPKYATILCTVSARAGAVCWGMTLTGDVDHNMYSIHQVTDGAYEVGGNFANVQWGTNDVLQLFSALTSDGVSITKNRVGNPQGTLSYKITFFG